MPSARAATWIRPVSSPTIIWVKPTPSTLPSNAPAGTRQSWNDSSQLSTPLSELGQAAQTSKPGAFSTSRMLIPRCAGWADGSVLHSNATTPRGGRW